METLDTIAAAAQTHQPVRILPADQPLRHLPAVTLEAATAARLLHGQAVAGGTEAGTVRLYDGAGTFLGLGEADGRGTLRPRRLFVSK
jgi:tRNA pseudouridine55 synthase